MTWLPCTSSHGFFILHFNVYTGSSKKVIQTVCTYKLWMRTTWNCTYMKTNFERWGLNIVCYFNAINSRRFIYYAPFFSIYSSKSFYFVCLKNNLNSMLFYRFPWVRKQLKKKNRSRNSKFSYFFFFFFFFLFFFLFCKKIHNQPMHHPLHGSGPFA